MGTFRCSGSDRLFHVDDISAFKPTTIPISSPITAQSVPRLEKISEAFQRIRYVSLKMRVVPQVSTATSGGYVAAFVADVADTIPDSQFGLSKLTSQAGAQTKKWWETATVSAYLSNDLLYTSFSPQDPRLSSPGKFVLAADGISSQRGSMTVYLDWDVLLSVPSLEGTEQEETSIFTSSKQIWTKAGTAGLWALLKPGDYNTLSQDARKCFLDPKPSSYLRFNGVRGFVENKSDVAGQLVSFDTLWIDANFNMYAYNSEDTYIKQLSFGHTMILAKGENFEPIDKGDKVSSFLRGSRFHCHVPAWLPSLERWDKIDNTFLNPTSNQSQNPLSHTQDFSQKSVMASRKNSLTLSELEI